MKDRLVELIQNAVGGCARHWAELIADALIANGVTVQQWIPVSERLPEHGDIVLCATKYEPEVKQWDSIARKWLGIQSIATVQSVTHWMPLPEPPKEGE